MLSKNEAETLLGIHLRECYPTATIVREYNFHPTRKWRFDWAIPLMKLAYECEGGIYSQGRHTRGSGFQADMIKYNEAAKARWYVFRFSTDDILKGRDLQYMR